MNPNEREDLIELRVRLRAASYRDTGLHLSAQEVLDLSQFLVNHPAKARWRPPPPYRGRTFSTDSNNRTHALSPRDDSETSGVTTAVCGLKFDKNVLLDDLDALVGVDCWNCRKKLGL